MSTYCKQKFGNKLSILRFAPLASIFIDFLSINTNEMKFTADCTGKMFIKSGFFAVSHFLLKEGSTFYNTFTAFALTFFNNTTSRQLLSSVLFRHSGNNCCGIHWFAFSFPVFLHFILIYLNVFLHFFFLQNTFFYMAFFTVKNWSFLQALYGMSSEEFNLTLDLTSPTPFICDGYAIKVGIPDRWEQVYNHEGAFQLGAETILKRTTGALSILQVAKTTMWMRRRLRGTRTL